MKRGHHPWPTGEEEEEEEGEEGYREGRGRGGPGGTGRWADVLLLPWDMVDTQAAHIKINTLLLQQDTPGERAGQIRQRRMGKMINVLVAFFQFRVHLQLTRQGVTTEERESTKHL